MKKAILAAVVAGSGGSTLRPCVSGCLVGGAEGGGGCGRAGSPGLGNGCGVWVCVFAATPAMSRNAARTPHFILEL